MDTLLACRRAWERTSDQLTFTIDADLPSAVEAAALGPSLLTRSERSGAAAQTCNTTAVSSQTLDGSLRELTAEGV
jgi:hypothetical protein